ncbi:MAG: cytochrome c family protein [Sphingomonadaceae bacterium]
MIRSALFVAAAAGSILAAPAMAQMPKGDPAAGQKVFAQCRACHVTDKGVNRVGPSLHGIVGRKAGTVPGFKYSKANAESGVTWTEENLFKYLENPRKFIPGTTMAFAGIRNPQQRADLIAWLRTQK